MLDKNSKKHKKQRLGLLNTSNNVRAMLVNARSVRNKFGELECLVAMNEWDIIAITETWLDLTNKDFIGEYKIKGYSLFHKDRVNKIGGGVLIYVRETLNPVEVETNTMHEIISIDLRLTKSIRIILVYRAPKQTNQLDLDLCKVLTKLIEGKISILMGDLNCPSINWESETANADDSIILDFYKDNFLWQFVDRTTRGNNILDLVFANEEELVSNIDIGNPIGSSDHNIIQFNIEVEANKNIKKYYNRLNYKAANWESLKKKLSEYVEKTKEIDQNSWDNFKNYFMKSQKEEIPTISVGVVR